MLWTPEESNFFDTNTFLPTNLYYNFNGWSSGFGLRLKVMSSRSQVAFLYRGGLCKGRGLVEPKVRISQGMAKKKKKKTYITFGLEMIRLKFVFFFLRKKKCFLKSIKTNYLSKMKKILVSFQGLIQG